MMNNNQRLVVDQIQAATPSCFSRSRSSSNWLQKLNGLPAAEANVAMEDVVSKLASSGSSTSSGGGGDGLSPGSSGAGSSGSPCSITSPGAGAAQGSPGGDGEDKGSFHSGGSSSSGTTTSSSSRCSSLYMFGLPASDFEQVVPQESISYSDGHQGVHQWTKRKRKQEKPRGWKQEEQAEAPLQEAEALFLKLQYDCSLKFRRSKQQQQQQQQEELQQEQQQHQGKMSDLFHGSEEMQQQQRKRGVPEHDKLLPVRDADLTPRFKVPRRTRLHSTTTGITTAGLNGITITNGSKWPVDHPACQPEDTLAFSVYKVFSKAGKCGLTTREAVSRIKDEGLPGLRESGVVPRVEVEGIVRTSPYFMELEDCKFVLCSAITAAEERQRRQRQQIEDEDDDEDEEEEEDEGAEEAEDEDEDELGHVKLAGFAVRKARTGKTRRKQNFTVPVAVELRTAAAATRTRREFKNVPAVTTAKPVQSRKRRLKTVQQDCTNLGERCNRSDGKGWHCPLRAQVGYLLCDHHLDRLRAKTGSKARRAGNKGSNVKNRNNTSTNTNTGGRNTNTNATTITRTGNRGRRKRKAASFDEVVTAAPPAAASHVPRDNTWALRRSLARLSVRISDDMDDAAAGRRNS